MSEKFYERFENKKQSKKPVKNKKQPDVHGNRNAHNLQEKKPFIKKAYGTNRHDENGMPFTLHDSLFGEIPADSKKILEDFDEIVQKIRPLNSKQFQELPFDIRDLSHLLTDERSERRTGYMNGQKELSAYIRYFQWWNLYRLTSLFSGLSKDAFGYLNDEDVILDIGSGPLTVPIALYLSRPELRKKKLTVYALDMSQTALSAGEELFLSVAARLCSGVDNIEPWNIVRVKGSFGTEIRKKASLVVCANMFNELYQNSGKLPEEEAKYCMKDISKYCMLSSEKAENGILLIEPGVPQSARFISLMRDSFIRNDYRIISPCPHEESCPMHGEHNKKWCHFVLNTEKAPKKLLRLSEKSGLPKDRAVMSFVYAVRGKPVPKKDAGEKLFVRIVSDEIKLPNYSFGRYSCSLKGLTLVTGKPCMELDSGKLISVNSRELDVKTRTDKKSGAIMFPLEKRS